MTDALLHTRAKGQVGEDMAIDYLVTQGYTIVDRNYQVKKGEIDCVARDRDGTLVFVEVKSAGSPSYGHPFSWINRAKQRKLVIMARHYLYNKHLGHTACRFDAIAIMDGKVEHLKNAFLA